MRHPWSFHRLRSGLTQERLADALGVSRYYIVRLEQGIYRRPSEELLTKLAAVFKINEGQLLAEYYKYQREVRIRFANEVDDFRRLANYTGTKHPLVAWREDYNLSRIGLCKELCLHQDSIRDYELQLQLGIPDQLVEACEQIGWSTEPLVNAVREWKLSGRSAAA